MLFRPIYNQDGNVTEIYYMEDGQTSIACDRRTLPTARLSLARAYNLDLSAQSRELKNKLNRTFPLPFYLPDGRVFVPLKMRKTVIVGDYTYGYCELNYIRSVRNSNGQVKLLLTTADEMPLYTTATAAYSTINMGKDVFEYLAGKFNGEQEKIMDALQILLDKLYRIEKILEKY